MNAKFFYAIVIFIGLVSASAQAQEIPPELTFADIMAAPSDGELNLRYAKQQAAKGNYLSALSALERILLNDDDNDEARLYYAEILQKVDDLQSVRREAKILAGRDLTDAQNERLIALGGEIATSARPTKSGFSGFVSAGIQYDDSSAEFLNNLGTILAKTDDVSYTVQGGVNYAHDMGNGTAATVSVKGQTLKREEFTRGNYDTLSGSIGLRGKRGDVGWALNASLSQIYLDGDKYLTQHGPTASVYKKVGKKTQVYGVAAYFDQTHRNLSFTQTEPLRDGSYVRIGGGMQHQLTKTLTVNAGLHYENKNAETELFAYDGIRAEASATVRLPKRAYLRANSLLRKSSYNETAAAFARDRKDTHFSVRAAAGIPLSSLGADSKLADAMSIEVGVSYLDRSSNIALPSTTNTGADARLTWTF